MKAKPVEVNNVSITYITGDFRNIGFKEICGQKDYRQL